MSLSSVPALLDIPRKLHPMISRVNDYRYFLLHGGRGGAKSQSICRFLLYMAEQSRLRIVCGRETQASISESSYTLLTDLVQKYDLDFEVTATKIISRKTGSVITFRGFREQGVFAIQGMEAIDCVFIDEAQALTKTTLDVLIPTIRKEKAKIFFSMNRFQPNDPVYSMFAGRSDCLTLQINYDDNPHCPQALIHEAEQCKIQNPKDYAHIWLGQPVDQTEDSVYSVSDLEDSKTRDFSLEHGYGERVAGFDIARYGDDANSAIVLQQFGPRSWKLIHSAEWRGLDLAWTTGKILEIVNQFNVSRAAVDIDGMGAGPFDFLANGGRSSVFHGFSNIKISHKEFVNQRTKFAFKLKDFLRKGHIALPGDEALIIELLSIKYEFDSSQRRALVTKERMRKLGVKSPNKADALIYATSMIEEVSEQQQRPYESNRQPQYSDQAWNPFANDGVDLFGIAGV